jgi:predicted dinucleotide-utilizing enzyme
MKNARVAIVGCGFVGKAMSKLVTDAVIYDTAPGIPADRETINGCDVAFVRFMGSRSANDRIFQM